MRKTIGSVIMTVAIVTAVGCSAAPPSMATSQGGSESAANSEDDQPSDNSEEGSYSTGETDDPATSGESKNTTTVIEVTDPTKSLDEGTDPEEGDLIPPDGAGITGDPGPSEDPTDPADPADPADPTDPSDPGAEDTVAGSAEDPYGEETTGDEVTANQGIPSNLPPELRTELDKTENGLILIYEPEDFAEINAITRWTIVEFESEEELFLVTKNKGSIVELARALPGEEGEDLVFGDVVRNWETTSDYEVLRIHYSDPETVPYYLIRVRQPDGQVTQIPLSDREDEVGQWESFQYQMKE